MYRPIALFFMFLPPMPGPWKRPGTSLSTPSSSTSRTLSHPPKDRGPDLLARALLADYGGRARIVRINGLDTEWGEGDARSLPAVPMRC